MAKLGALVFAGGVGQRLWPLSRRNSPKQFAPLVGTRSSFQLAVDRLTTLMPSECIYVGTNRKYEALLKAQTPEIPERNFILEPARRDVAAAVALAFFTLERDGISGPFVFQWADNYVKNTDGLLAALESGRKLVEENPQRLVFLGERPRFANENLGWIELGDELGRVDGAAYHAHRSWQYRPPKAECERMFASGRYVWNSGYFVTSVEFMTRAFREHASELAQEIERIVAFRGTSQERQKLDELYPQVPSLHFDDAILTRLAPHEGVLMPVDLGWSDPGSLYSLKEALQESAEGSVARGDVVAVESRDCLLYATSPNKVVATLGLDGVIVVDTPDVLLVVHKDRVRDLGKLLDELARAGHDELL